jgi:hypothetical protein
VPEEEYMARTASVNDVSTLQMALVGYQIEKQKIEQKIEEIRAQLKGKGGAMPAAMGEAQAPRRRELSPAARRRIADAQKRRWAEHRRRAAQAAKAQKAAAAKPQVKASGTASS